MTDIFDTDRLTARHITSDDYAVMYATYSDPDAMRWVDDGSPITVKDCRRWFSNTLTNYGTRGYGISALCLRAGDGLGEAGDVIGFCGLVHPGGQVEPELKYALRRPWWGRGLATEAAVGMLAYGARAFGMHRIIATVAEPHRASQRVLEKAGMIRESVLAEDDGSRTVVYAWQPARAHPGG